MENNCVSIQELINKIPNFSQKRSLEKILLTDEEDKIYMDSFETIHVSVELRELSPENNISGIFTVFGSIHHSTGLRDKYTIKMNYPLNVDGFSTVSPINQLPPNIYHEAKKTFHCNCIDYKLHAIRQNKVCKHICFIMLNICGPIVLKFSSFTFSAIV